ncbi:alpha/beta hydrolase family protein [Actinoplanes sp. GCM10030250]|uniref:alpha/beta hydrolase family protein n=1 Tax=Actinoplanes sp. GCM10030250 TaxID=3273376 RepID=UPI00360FBFEC
MGEKRVWGCALVAALVTLVAAGSPARASEPLHLTAPTGPHRVGATDLYVKDTSRSDPWVPSQNYRELMVTVWYPTDARRGTATEYLSAEESRLMVTGKGLEGVPPEIFSTVRTYALAGAPPAGRARSLPLVVLSPGYTQPRATLTALAEDLASHGYVVAGVDHTYENHAITFPDGRIAGCVACEQDSERPFFGKLYQSRAADVSFVIDRLTGRHPAWRGSRLIDATRIGMSGHSAGGASAIAAMVRDPRIDAGINMDGTTDTGGASMIPPAGFPRPFLWFGAPHHAPTPEGQDPWWDRDHAAMTGWKRWMTVAGTVHASTSDLALFADQLGIDIGATTSGERAVEIMRRYNLAMFDQHLRHHPQPLLDAPSSRYPEVVFA